MMVSPLLIGRDWNAGSFREDFKTGGNGFVACIPLKGSHYPNNSTPLNPGFFVARRFTPVGSDGRRDFRHVSRLQKGGGAHFPIGDTIMVLREIVLQAKAQDVAEPVKTELSVEKLCSGSGGKHIPKASPVLMSACATGQHLREATITHR